MIKLIILTAVIATCTCFVNGQFSCYTPSGSEGECQPIRDCEPLLNLFKSVDRTAEQSDILRKSHCGYQEGIPKVCCPSQCITPEGKPGKCVDIESCSHLADMLKSSARYVRDTRYVENSRCQGSDQHKVCCGPPPDSPISDCAATITAIPPDPKSECCGIDSYAGNRITGGNDTSIEQYPWLVLIEYVQGDQIHTSCGGSLISSKYVLTAAHCVRGRFPHGPPTNIRLGEYDTSNEGPDGYELEPGIKDYTDGTVVIPIESIIPHPAYSTFISYTASKHDIALVRMARPAPYTDFIRPICLPTIDVSVSPPDNFIAAGWGAVSDAQANSNIKQHVALPYVNLQKCRAAYSLPDRYAELGDGQVCAGGEAGKDSCRGDSGGPLMYQNKRIIEVGGVVSFGIDKCGSYDVPAVYTKVFKYNGWIRRNIMP